MQENAENNAHSQFCVRTQNNFVNFKLNIFSISKRKGDKNA